MYHACPLFDGVEVQMKNAGACKSRTKWYCLANGSLFTSGELALVPALICLLLAHHVSILPSLHC